MAQIQSLGSSRGNLQNLIICANNRRKRCAGRAGHDVFHAGFRALKIQVYRVIT